jgi:hypothetical protein
VLKAILRYIGAVLDITIYDRMLQLTYKIFVEKREEFFRMFELHE